MYNDLAITHGTLVYPEGIKKRHIFIKDGKIRKICEIEEMVENCKEIIDASGYIIFPGMIDSHVHIRGGALSYREDFKSGSKAALSSGITTLLEMPGCAKPASTYAHFVERVKEVKRDGQINIQLYGGAGHDNLEEIPRLAEAGAIGFKTFQMPPVKGREKEFYGLCSETYEDLIKVMTKVKSTGLTLTVHCEHSPTIEKLTLELQAKGEGGLSAFCASRPPEAELESVRQVIKATKKTGCKVIIAHVSCPATIKLIQRARQEGIKIYSETCAHYLCFSKEEMEPYGVFARMKPPFRSQAQVEELARMYEEGFIDITGSDHAPYTKEEKLKNGEDIWQSYDGLCGLELTLPLLLKLVEEKKLTYERIVQCFAENTAHLFQLKDKGRLEEGRDADLVLIEKLDESYKLAIEQLHTKCKESAIIYEGLSLKHKIVGTMYGGKLVRQEG